MTVARPAADERVCLLELDPQLESLLGPKGAEAVGRRPLMPVVCASVGPWRPAGVPAGTAALAVLEGLLLRETREPGGASLSGPGDLVEPWTAELRWSAWLPLRMAVIGRPLLSALRPWPDVVARLLGRALQQESRGLPAQAMAYRANDEQRMLGQITHLADRWGLSTAGGRRLVLAVPAELLGRLAGVAPLAVAGTVRRLGQRGLAVQQHDGTWLLRPGNAHAAAARERDERREALTTAFARASDAYSVAVAESARLAGDLQG
jgi:hypothetical protein